jgi:hypothetical protein
VCVLGLGAKHQLHQAQVKHRVHCTAWEQQQLHALRDYQQVHMLCTRASNAHHSTAQSSTAPACSVATGNVLQGTCSKHANCTQHSTHSCTAASLMHALHCTALHFAFPAPPPPPAPVSPFPCPALCPCLPLLVPSVSLAPLYPLGTLPGSTSMSKQGSKKTGPPAPPVSE